MTKLAKDVVDAQFYQKSTEYGVRMYVCTYLVVTRFALRGTNFICIVWDTPIHMHHVRTGGNNYLGTPYITT